MRQEDRDAIRDNYLGDEDGHIYFFYRPKALEASGVQDIDQLYIVLRPLASKTFRLISIDAQGLPQPGSDFNFVTGRVEKVETKPFSIEHELRERFKQVRGVPDVSQGAARPCGEGVYTLISRNDGEHLFYVLELPERGQVARQINLTKEGDFRFGVFNPYYGVDPAEMDPQVNPVFPESLRYKLDNERVIFKDVPRYIDFEGTQVALYREDSIPGREIREQMHPLKENASTTDIFEDLRLNRKRYPVEPLLRGDFK